MVIERNIKQFLSPTIMNRINYGVDIDDVLLVLTPGIVEFHNDRYGTRIKPCEITSQNFTQQFGTSLATLRTRLHLFYQTRQFENLPMVKGAYEGILRLRESGIPHLITSREDILRAITKSRIKREFPPDTFMTLNYAKNPFMEKDERPTKPEICRRLSIKIMIEDNLEHVLAISKVKGIELVYLLDLDGEYGWNHTDEKLPENVQRVSSWDEIR